MVKRLQAAIAAAEHLSTDKQEKLAISLEEMIDELEWDTLTSTPKAHAFHRKLAEKAHKELADGTAQEIQEDWAE